ncbi:MAG: protein kinase [Syntrophobacteraceae bacterium]|jgi:serine/threonine-protein kinase
MGKPDKITGKKIDQFIVESFIAEGAMGMVFKAFDSTLARVVALKLIPKNSTDATDSEALNRAEAQKRLIREAQTAGKLVHPNIVTIHSYGETDEFQYICMEYIQGKTLSQILKERGSIPVEEAIPILEQILLALETADRASVVHRDIKPSNIIMTEDNRVKVMDFGIAKFSSLSFTVTGMILGTPYYMSPEQICGKKVDIRSDIFSLGTVFYELLTGEKAFEAENTATLVYKIVQSDPVPPNIVNVNIPQAVAGVISKALAKDPSQRYQKPAEMLRDVKALASGVQTQSGTEASSQSFFDRTMLADPTQSDGPSTSGISRPHGLPLGPQLPSAGPKEGAAYRLEEAGTGLPEALKAKPNIPAIVLLLLLLAVCAGGGALWYFNRAPVQQPKPAVSMQAGGSRQVQSPLLSANTGAAPPAPQAGRSEPSVEALLVDAEKQLTSNPEGARKLLEQALARDPNSYESAVILARLLASRKDYPAAVQRYKQALGLNGRNAEVLYELGCVYMELADLNTAIESFEASLALAPHNRDEVLAGIGICYMKKGSVDRAELFFKQSLDANPNNAAARTYLASIAAKTIPPVVSGAGVAPSQSGQPGPQASAERPVPVVKSPMNSSGVRLGNYTLEGINPNGAKYSGKAEIAQSGARYSVTWKIADQTLTGTGVLMGRILTVNRKGPGAVNGVVVYGMGANGALNGTWGSGRGKETLVPLD